MQKLTEEGSKATIDQWKADAAKVKTPDQLRDFVLHLIGDYTHDYGTICHAMHAAMKAAMHVVNESPQGGITGFQASCLGWMLIDDLMSSGKGPKQLVSFENMLFPQYEDRFGAIDSDTWTWLQEEARKRIADFEAAPVHPEYGVTVHPDVVKHWRSVAAGSVPFGYTVRA